jgi:hypothetical protein
MSIEQYIVRELKQDIKYLIRKVTELEKKLEEAHPSPKPYTESQRMQDELEPIDDTFKRYAGYREWNKTHDNYKVIHSPTNTDEHGKKIKDD